MDQFVGLLSVLSPLYGHRPSLDEGVVVPAIGLDQHRDKDGINDLASFEFNAHLGKYLVLAIKQDLGELVLFEGFTKGPHGTRIGDVACQFNSQKSHERQAVCDLVLQPLVRQPMQALQDEHFEHQDVALGLASSLVFTFFGVNVLKDGAKYPPSR